MDTAVEILDGLAYPGFLLLLSLMLLFGAHRLRLLGERWVGVLGLLCLVGFVLLSVRHPVLSDLLFAPQCLPATLCALATPVVAWFIRPRQAQSRLLDVDEGVAPTPTAFSRGEALVAVSVLGFVALLALVFDAPLSGPVRGVLEPTHLPWFLAGWQEMRSVLQPSLGWFVGPLLVAGLLALPYLEIPPEDPNESRSRQEATRLFLFFGVTLGWVPMVVAMYLRTPQWQLKGLLAVREPVESLSLADGFWLQLMGMPPPQAWWWRELPGGLAIAAYLLTLWVILPRWRASRGLFQRYRKGLGTVRYRGALVLFAALGWLPLKLLFYWFFAIGDWVVLPFWPGGL